MSQQQTEARPLQLVPLVVASIVALALVACPDTDPPGGTGSDGGGIGDTGVSSDSGFSDSGSSDSGGAPTYQLSISILGTGTGAVTCGGSVCPSVVDAGGSVVLVANPSPDSTFAGWGEACAGTSSTCALTASSDLVVTATFAALNPPAEVYWVSPSGAASWDSCQSEAPLDSAAACSLATANANVAAGDFVSLRAGTYDTPIAPDASGALGDRITFKGSSGEQVLITGIDVAIDLEDRGFVTVDGVTADGNRELANLKGSSHVWLINSTLVNCTETSDWVEGIRMYNNAKYNWLANNTIGGCGYMTATDDIGGVMRFGYDGNPDDETSYNLLENNYLFHGGHHVIQISARYNILRNNICHNEDWTPCERPSTGNLCGNRCIVLVDSTPDAYWNVFEGNRFGFNGGSIDDATAAGGLSARTQHNIVRHNEFIFTGGAGLSLPSNGTYNDPSHTHVYHNVFYQNGISPLSAGDLRYTYALVFDNWNGAGNPTPITGVALKNNLFYDNAGGDVFFYYTDPAAQADLSGNYYALASDPLPGPNVVSGDDPMFADVAAPADPAHIRDFDLQLRDGSPAIDQGAFLTTAVGAATGTVLTVADAAYFIDGYGIVDGDRVQLEGQTQTAMILAIDYQTNEMTVDTELTWTDGQGVAMPYNGSRPDIGAWEK